MQIASLLLNWQKTDFFYKTQIFLQNIDIFTKNTGISLQENRNCLAKQQIFFTQKHRYSLLQKNTHTLLHKKKHESFLLHKRIDC